MNTDILLTAVLMPACGRLYNWITVSTINNNSILSMRTEVGCTVSKLQSFCHSVDLGLPLKHPGNFIIECNVE